MTTVMRSRATQIHTVYTATSAFSNTGLTKDQLRKVVPSVFAEHPWKGNGEHLGVSEKYAFVPTIAHIEQLMADNWVVTYATQGRSPIEGKTEFTRHMLRLRHVDATITDRRALEVVLINSHDADTSLRGYVGFIEFVCWNGCVSGEVTDSFRLRHRGNADRITVLVQEVFSHGPAILERLEQYEQLMLSRKEQLDYATAAMLLRYPAPPTIVNGIVIADAPPTTTHFPFSPEKLLPPAAQHNGHQDESLQSAFMRAQTGLIQHGGIPGRTSTGSRRRNSSVKDITKNIGLNQALSLLTERMAEMKKS